jgi:hypothetical protein
VIFFLLLALGLHLQPVAAVGDVSDPVLSRKIDKLFLTIIDSNDESEEARAKSEVQAILAQHGLPAIPEVGDEAAYEFVMLLAGDGFPLDVRQQLLMQITQAAARHEIPLDAAKLYAARLRIEEVKAEAESHPPSQPGLRARIEQMYKLDQSVFLPTG